MKNEDEGAATECLPVFCVSIISTVIMSLSPKLDVSYFFSISMLLNLIMYDFASLWLLSWLFAYARSSNVFQLFFLAPIMITVHIHYPAACLVHLESPETSSPNSTSNEYT